MSIIEKDVGGTSAPNGGIDPSPRSSLSSAASTDSGIAGGDTEEAQSIHQTPSRNARLEEPDNALTHVSTAATNATQATQDVRFEVDFDENGENPQDWPVWKKGSRWFVHSPHH